VSVFGKCCAEESNSERVQSPNEMFLDWDDAVLPEENWKGLRAMGEKEQRAADQPCAAVLGLRDQRLKSKGFAGPNWPSLVRRGSCLTPQLILMF
jgi:hypothetical protein